MTARRALFTVVCLVGSLASLGCIRDPLSVDSETEDGGSTATPDVTGVTTLPSATNPTTPTSGVMTNDGTADSTVGGSRGEGPGSTSAGSSGEGSSSGGGSGFMFRRNPADDYETLDRVAFPLTNAAFVVLGDKDAYNFGTPEDDAALAFVPDLLTSLETWHLGGPGFQVPDNTGVADDLLALGLTPCTPDPLPMPTCSAQILPLIVPDVVALDLNEVPAFPNGRQPSEPAMDILLAAMLLDLSNHPVTLFLDLDGDGVPGPSLNPLTNDVAFPAEFPYLAPPHGG